MNDQIENKALQTAIIEGLASGKAADFDIEVFQKRMIEGRNNDKRLSEK